MKVERMIRLDEPLERRIITDARRSVSIAFEPDNVEAKQRLLGGLANGDVVSEKRVGEAIDLLLEVRLAISEDIKHYERLRDDPPPMERLPEGAIPVIADPQVMAYVLIESRQVQRIEVTEALMLLRTAQKAMVG